VNCRQSPHQRPACEDGAHGQAIDYESLQHATSPIRRACFAIHNKAAE
jgi:hypothetical protein